MDLPVLLVIPCSILKLKACRRNNKSTISRLLGSPLGYWASPHSVPSDVSKEHLKVRPQRVIILQMISSDYLEVSKSHLSHSLKWIHQAGPAGLNIQRRKGQTNRVGLE